MYESESAYVAFYRLSIAKLFKIILVVDNEDRLAGILTLSDFRFQHTGNGMLGDLEDGSVSTGEICNRHYTYLREEQDIYLYGRSLFAQSSIQTIPVIDQHGRPVRLFARWQAFFKEYLESNKLGYPFYAKCIHDAAWYAKGKGYDAISVIEFGVASGRGLIHCELFAMEVEKLTGIRIDVYGFDSAQGLLGSSDHRDMPHVFSEGEYAMNHGMLSGRLQKAKLVLGDICETAISFLKDYTPAPIGAMFIDVDMYTPTAAILEMLLESDEFFLPIVNMYFDDISADYQFQGEWLAVHEFNEKNEHIKISPNDPLINYNIAYPPETYWWASKLKQCLRFAHKNFPRGAERRKQLPLSL
jgi:hypothetical protein